MPDWVRYGSLVLLVLTSSFYANIAYDRYRGRTTFDNCPKWIEKWGGWLTLPSVILLFFHALESKYINTGQNVPFLSVQSDGFQRNYLLAMLVLSGLMIFVLWRSLLTGEKPRPKGSLSPEDAISRFSLHLGVQKHLKEAMVDEYAKYAVKEKNLTPDLVDRQAVQAGRLVRLLPGSVMMEKGRTPIKLAFHEYLRKLTDEDEMEDITSKLNQLGGYREVFNETPVDYYLPNDLRTQHHQIIAGSGHGKTQCIQSMIMEDWTTDASIVVIDSQGDLINNILAHAPLDRVVLIDPETCPPSLNIFATKVKGEKETATAIELYEYIFSALDAGLTGKQSLVYRYLSRLLMEIPGASIETMRDLLKPGGTEPYQPFIDNLSGNARTFFEEFQREKNNQYSDTRQEVLRRLLTVLESETLSKMLASPEMAFDFPTLLDSGKIILINTAKGLLKDGSSLFGRIFIALVMQAVMGRKEERRRTYLYIDEFADYAEDSQVLFNLFEQSRKYELGLVVCHQYLSQLPERLRKSLSSNTAIKFAGGVSAEDARALASQMQTTAEAIQAQPALSFSAWFKGVGTVTWTVEPGRLEKTNKHSRETLDDFRTLMIREYGARKPLPHVPPMKREEPQERW